MERVLSFFSFSSEIALSDIISVIALFLSLISTFIVCYRERFSVSVECTKILLNFDNQFSPPTFELMILNRSTLPISIKKIEFRTRKQHFPFNPTPSYIFNNHQDATRHLFFIREDTTGFPIVIDGLSALSAFFQWKKTSSLSVQELRTLSGRFYLYTSRKKIYKTRSISLNDIQIIICDLEREKIIYNSHPE